MSGSKSRRKGARGEREFSKKFGEIVGKNLARGRQFKGGPDSPDITGLEKHNLHAEVKRTESTLALATYKAIGQASSECGEKVPFIASRRNNKEWLIVVRMDDVISFCKGVLSAYNSEENDKS